MKSNSWTHANGITLRGITAQGGGFEVEMIDDRARQLSAGALAPLATRLTIAPGVVTGLGLLVGLGAALAASRGWWVAALVGWLLNRLFDGLDGIVARNTGRHSDLGGYLDMVADVIVYGALPLGVAFGRAEQGAWIAAGFLVASFYLNIVSWLYLSALLEKQQAGAAVNGQSTAVAMPRGLVEGTETIVFFAVLLAVPSLALWTMAVMAFAVLLTSALHIGGAVRLLRPEAGPA